MSAYTKDQFEEYKGTSEFLTVKYLYCGKEESIDHKDYEDYINTFASYKDMNQHCKEQDQFEKDREIVSEVLADIPSVCDFMNDCDEDDFDNHERMLIDIYKFLQKKWCKK